MIRELQPGPETASRLSDLATRWGAPSAPLLSEHTILQIGSGRGVAWLDHRPTGGLLAMVPGTTAASGLLEVAALSRERARRIWEAGRTMVLERAVAEGLSPLVGLDRFGVFSGVEDPGAVLRMTMQLEGLDPIDPGSRFRHGDERQILRVNNEAFRGHPENGNWALDDLRERITQPWFDPAGLLVERADGTLLGFCWTKVHPDRVGEIYLIAVDPSRRGSGLGRSLVRRGLSRLRGELGLGEAIVYTAEDNAPARGLYDSLGFTVDGVVRRVRLD